MTATVESERVTFVNNEVVEVRLQSIRGPAFLDCPSTGTLRDGNSPDAVFLASNQHLAFRSQRGLHDAVDRPLVLPQFLAVGHRNADHACAAHDEYLLNAADRYELWRAVTPTRRWSKPTPRTICSVVSDELT